MKLLLNAGFGAPLGADLAQIGALGFDGVRQELAPNVTNDQARAVLSEFAASNLTCLLLLGPGRMEHDGEAWSPSELAAHARRCHALAVECGIDPERLWFEVGNEPDIAQSAFAGDATWFALASQLVYRELREANFEGPICVGSVSNLNRRGLDYLAAMNWPALPPDATLSFHRYPRRRNPALPHDDFVSRDAEWAVLLARADGRMMACTECGYHTAKQRDSFWNSSRLTDEQATERILFEVAWFASYGCAAFTIYQWQDGLSDAPSDRFGIRRADGSLKPQASIPVLWRRTLGEDHG